MYNYTVISFSFVAKTYKLYFYELVIIFSGSLNIFFFFFLFLLKFK